MDSGGRFSSLQESSEPPRRRRQSRAAAAISSRAISSWPTSASAGTAVAPLTVAVAVAIGRINVEHHGGRKPRWSYRREVGSYTRCPTIYPTKSF